MDTIPTQGALREQSRNMIAKLTAQRDELQEALLAIVRTCEATSSMDPALHTCLMTARSAIAKVLAQS